MKNGMTALASAVALGLGLSGAVQAQNDSILIGVQVPTTGSEATYGQDMYNAAELAAEEINAEGGVLGMDVRGTGHCRWLLLRRHHADAQGLRR